MKTSILALALACALSLELTSFAQDSGAVKTSSINGTVMVTRDKAGKITLVALKTEKGNLLVPTKANESFAAYEGKKVKACCAVQGNAVVPLCVTGLIQAQKIPAGK